MGKFSRFEEIVTWQKPREIVNEIYDIFGNPGIKKDFVLQYLITRASLSVMLNIAVGFGGKLKQIQAVSCYCSWFKSGSSIRLVYCS